MSTAFAAIVSAIVANLNAATPVCAHVYRNLQRPLPDSVTTAVVVRQGVPTTENNQMSGYPIEWVTPIVVECYARTSSTTPDLAVDDLLQATYTRLLADQTLGGVLSDQLMGINITGLHFGFDADTEKFACATLTLEVRHRTNGTTLT